MGVNKASILSDFYIQTDWKIKSNRPDTVVKDYKSGVMVIVVGKGHGDTSSNPGRDWLHFTYH